MSARDCQRARCRRPHSPGLSVKLGIICRFGSTMPKTTISSVSPDRTIVMVNLVLSLFTRFTSVVGYVWCTAFYGLARFGYCLYNLIPRSHATGKFARHMCSDHFFFADRGASVQLTGLSAKSAARFRVARCGRNSLYSQRLRTNLRTVDRETASVHTIPESNARARGRQGVRIPCACIEARKSACANGS